MFHCLVIKVVSLLFSKQLVHIITCSSVCQQLFWTSFDWEIQNGEGGIWTLAPLLTTYSLSRGAPSASLGTSPNTARSCAWHDDVYKKLPANRLVVFQAERVGFEPTRPLGQTVFKTASLWPLRYLSTYSIFVVLSQRQYAFYHTKNLASISNFQELLFFSI